MYCTKCGTTFPDVYIYCPECGQEAHMVSKEDLLEDDLLQGIIDDDDQKPNRNFTGRVGSYRSKTRERIKKRQEEEKRKKKMRRNILVVVIILAAAAAAAAAFLIYTRNHSVDYLMEKAEKAYETKDYPTARNSLDKVLALDEENMDALILAGTIDTIMKDYGQAEQLLLKALEIDPLNADAYRNLISLYDKQGQRDKIMALMDRTHNQEILALFENYIVPVPVIDTEGGTYTDDLTISITAENKKLVIYYTLDGSVPDEKSEIYTYPIELKEEGDYVITAACLDEEGFFSDPVKEEYSIHFNAPPMPQVSPDGGRFNHAVELTVTIPEGTTVYYTWNGSNPDESSRAVTGTLTIPEGNNILTLVAIDKHGLKSKTLKCNYIYYPEVQSRDWVEDTDADTESSDGTESSDDTEESENTENEV